MGIRRLGIGLLALAALAGCGTVPSNNKLSLQQLPLVPGATIVSHAIQCDRGSNPFCAIQAVIVDHGFTSSGAFLASENRRLHELGWKNSAGDDSVEVAADSPNQKLRVTFATGLDDLIGIDERWIKRPSNIEMALDRTIFERAPAVSIMLETGPT